MCIISESIQNLSEVFNCSYMECPNNAATAKQKYGNCSKELDGYACSINRVLETTPKGNAFFNKISRLVYKRVYTMKLREWGRAPSS